MKIILNYNVSIEQNSGIDRYRTKPGIEPALMITISITQVTRHSQYDLYKKLRLYVFLRLSLNIQSVIPVVTSLTPLT